MIHINIICDSLTNTTNAEFESFQKIYTLISLVSLAPLKPYLELWCYLISRVNFPICKHINLTPLSWPFRRFAQQHGKQNSVRYHENIASAGSGINFNYRGPSIVSHNNGWIEGNQYASHFLDPVGILLKVMDPDGPRIDSGIDLGHSFKLQEIRPSGFGKTSWYCEHLCWFWYQFQLLWLFHRFTQQHGKQNSVQYCENIATVENKIELDYNNMLHLQPSHTIHMEI
jgi:hypothetical protein